MNGVATESMQETQAIGTAARLHRTREGQVFTLRPCRGFAELDQCIALQQQTWGYPDIEVVPRNEYVLAQALGGHVLGAWDAAGTLAGFALAMAAHEPHPASPGGAGQAALPPIPYLHSHMLAVVPLYRNRGLGYALKQAQRSLALAAGIRRMRWTFDPLMAKNAFFNLRRLGATTRVYLPNFYGELGSTLQGGLPSDRLLVEWALDAPPSTGRAASFLPSSIIELPASIPQWRQSGAFAELEAAQRRLRAQFQQAFAQGLTISDFSPDGQGGGVYRLAPRITRDT